MVKPTFFVLGAGKSGTTSLYNYLKQHPDIFMSRIKEPTFFCESFQVVKNPIDYFQLFDDAPGHRAIGEASHAYLTNPSTPKVLRTLFPNAKMIVIFRDPAMRAHSLYHHMRRYGHERINSFERALEAEEWRATSERFRSQCPQYLYNFLYFRSGLFGEQVARYFSHFPAEQFSFVTLDDLKAQPIATMRRLYDFLGVDVTFKPRFEIHNKGSFTARNALIQYALRHKIPRPGKIGTSIYRALVDMNRTPVPQIREDTYTELVGRYQSDLELLHALTGVSLTLNAQRNNRRRTAGNDDEGRQ